MSDEQQPYVPAESTMAELTVKAVVLGVVLAAIMGAANAYLALKAGQTVSATFPAAILALAAFRLPFFRGTILEQNVARAAGTVGEALAAGAIFTIPAFLLVTVNGEPGLVCPSGSFMRNETVVGTEPTNGSSHA